MYLKLAVLALTTVFLTNCGPQTRTPMKGSPTTTANPNVVGKALGTDVKVVNVDEKNRVIDLEVEKNVDRRTVSEKLEIVLVLNVKGSKKEIPVYIDSNKKLSGVDGVSLGQAECLKGAVPNSNILKHCVVWQFALSLPDDSGRSANTRVTLARLEGQVVDQVIIDGDQEKRNQVATARYVETILDQGEENSQTNRSIKIVGSNQNQQSDFAYEWPHGIDSTTIEINGLLSEEDVKKGEKLDINSGDNQGLLIERNGTGTHITLNLWKKDRDGKQASSVVLALDVPVGETKPNAQPVVLKVEPVKEEPTDKEETKKGGTTSEDADSDSDNAEKKKTASDSDSDSDSDADSNKKDPKKEEPKGEEGSKTETKTSEATGNTLGQLFNKPVKWEKVPSTTHKTGI